MGRLIRRVRALRLVAAALVVAATGASFALAAPAAAHEEAPGVRTTFDGSDPALPSDVTVTVVVSAADQLLLENRGQQIVEVLAEDGSPFLRIGGGHAEANATSPWFYLTSAPDGSASVPPDAKVGAPARWVRIADQPVWGWFDHRLHPAPIGIPPGAKPGQVLHLDDWTVSVHIGDVEHRLRGHREYVRPAGQLQVGLVANDGVPSSARATIVQGRVPGLFLDASLAVASGPLVVLGPGSEPLARFSTDGVEVNEASPTWGLTAAANDRPVTGQVGIDLEPRWVRQSPQARLTWLEPRARYPESTPPPEIQARKRATTLVRWSVPILVGSAATRAELRGETAWLPDGVSGATSRDGQRWLLPAGAVGLGAIAAAAGLVLVRRRVRR